MVFYKHKNELKDSDGLCHKIKRRIVMKFYICRHCGNIVTKLTSSKVPLHCCGQPMELLEAGVTDAATEKHVPVVSVEGNLVKVAVGAVAHPMVEEHFIQWVAVETERDALVHWPRSCASWKPARPRRRCSPWRMASR